MSTNKDCTICKGRKRLRVPKGNLLDENVSYGPMVEFHEINCPRCGGTGLEPPEEQPIIIKQQSSRRPALVA